MKKNCGIYQIQNLINGKVYVGSAKDLRERKIRHFLHLKQNRHCNNKLQKAFNKYDADNFEFSVIEYVDNFNNLLKLEQWYLDTYDCVKNGYNICSTAGSTLGRKVWLGKKHTEESKLKISAALKGMPKSERHKQKLSEKRKDVKYSQEYKDNMSLVTQKTYCKNGHEFTDNNIIIEYRKSNGRTLKRCKICRTKYNNYFTSQRKEVI